MNSNPACISVTSSSSYSCAKVADGRRNALPCEALSGRAHAAVCTAAGKARAHARVAQGNGSCRLVVRSQQTNEGLDEKSWAPLRVSHKMGDLVGEKYKIVGILGEGGVGTTYLAETEVGTAVALKAMSLRNMKVWKDLELFRREARVLKSLRHANIPEYIDYFEVDSVSDRAFYIIQKVASGKSLAELSLGGWRVTEQEVIRIALEVLDVLDYLRNLRPPVYHRDIKPENIILDSATGTVKVVDFGAVQDAASVTLIGSTVVGTYGYMAPEQFQNRATAQTDLYGLGGTLLFLLSGRCPSSFAQQRLKVDFGTVIMSPRLAIVIDRLLEPAPEDRYQTPLAVTNALKNMDRPGGDFDSMIVNSYNTGWTTKSTKQKELRKVGKPAGTKVELLKTRECLEFTIPAGGLNAETAGTGSFTLAWNAILTLWTKTAWGGGGAPAAFALFSLPFWFVGIRLTKQTLSSLAIVVNVKFYEQFFAIEWRIGSLWKRRVTGSTEDINLADVFADEGRSGRSTTTCRLVEGVKEHTFGSGLQPVEQYWIVQEMRDFLGLLDREGTRLWGQKGETDCHAAQRAQVRGALWVRSCWRAKSLF